MLDESTSGAEMRVLVLAPTTRDGEVTRTLLAQAGLTTAVCSDLTQLCREITLGAGAVLLTAEALASKGIGELVATLKAQPSWSDLPLVLLLQGRQHSATFNGLLEDLGNVTLLERPAPVRSVVSSLQTAVRGRQRQYQTRDHIGASERAEARARLLQEQLTIALESERAARAETERVSQMKDEFLATLSHELRTPLNAIYGWAQLLKMDHENPDTIEEGIEVIDRNVRIQTQLIEDLLDMSRIISGKIQLNIQPVALPELIRAAIETVKPAADAKRLRLEAAIDRQAGPVSGDTGRLQQVFWNLLTNAIKFTPDGGTIQIGLKRDESYVEIRVADSGEGIQPEFVPHLFERFSQADASTTRKHGGLGLGLSIVKNLVELHGGTIRAESPGKGLGASFIIRLPISATIATKVTTASPRRLRSAGFDCSSALSGLKVMVVDDEADARQLIHRFLVECGATAGLAASAAEARELLDAFKPDVIISDIGMPGEDGYEFIRAVRNNGHKTPAVALTAFARSADRIRSIQAGYQTHLPKPVAPAELVAIVASLAGRF